MRLYRIKWDAERLDRNNRKIELINGNGARDERSLVSKNKLGCLRICRRPSFSLNEPRIKLFIVSINTNQRHSFQI